MRQGRRVRPKQATHGKRPLAQWQGSSTPRRSRRAPSLILTGVACAFAYTWAGAADAPPTGAPATQPTTLPASAPATAAAAAVMPSPVAAPPEPATVPAAAVVPLAPVTAPAAPVVPPSPPVLPVAAPPAPFTGPASIPTVALPAPGESPTIPSAPPVTPETRAAAAPTSVPAPPRPDGAPDDRGTLPDVVVLGRADNLVGVADSSNQGYVGQAELARRPLLRPAEIMEAIPGLVITQHSGAGKANQYFLRGFQLDHGTDFAVTLAGVPQNLPSHAHGQGYLDLNYLIPELVADINYRKGPYFADVGDFSAAGSADIRYVDTMPRGILQVEGGSYGYARGLVADSAPLDNGGHLLYAAEVYHEDGPWDYPDAYTRFNGVLRYSHGDTESGYSLTALGMHGDWHATDQVPRRAIDEGLIDRFGNLDSTDGGNSQRYTLVGEGHQKLENATANVLGWVTYYDLDLFSNFTYFLNDPVHGDQFEQQDRRVYAGVRGNYAWDGSIFGAPSTTTVGVQGRTDDIHNGLYHTEDRDRLSPVRRDSILETNVGIYVENRTKWTDKFRTVVGARGDYFNFDVDGLTEQNSGTRDAVIFSPKVNLIFGPWYDTEFYASAGYGFHSNDARGVLTKVSTDTIAPVAGATPLVRAKGAEVGARTTIVPGLQSTVSLWALDLDSELSFAGDTAEDEVSAASRRYGVEIANFYAPTKWLTLDADYSLSHARYHGFDPAGNHIPESIESVLEAGVTVHDLPNLKGWFGGLRLRYFGPRPLTQDDSVRSNSSTIFNAEIGYQFNENLTLKAEFLNLFDTKTDDIQYYYASRLPGEAAGGANDIHLHPAEPFEFRVGLTARF